MKPKISVITLGVHDLERAIRFYENGLGLPRYPFESNSIAFFQLEGTWLALYPLELLAKDIGIPNDAGGGFGGVTLAHNAAEKPEVDAILERAVQAGGTLVKPAEEAFWGGYSGYFRDPDGHYWEVAFNPFMDLT
jgi:catechol 2,3-dioxygenase-like lactoylglutathione lyase family enzyme